MNQITRFEFESKPLTFEKIDGEWWATMDEAADLLGYKDRDKVQALYARHRAEFLPSETCTLKLKVQGGQRRSVRVFSPKGLEHLAILGRTTTCTRFRRWLLDDVLERLRNDGRLITADQLERFASTIRAESASVIAALQATVTALAGAIGTQASAAGKFLSYIAHSPETRAAIAEARDKTMSLPFGQVADGNNRLSGLEGGNGNGHAA